jgi:hypothetical protein
MTEKYSGRAHYPPPPINRIFHKPQRPRSISNGLEREPKLQPVRVVERQLSVRTDSNVTPTIEKISKVAQLIEQFEKSKSTNNVHRSIKNLHVSPSLKQKKEPLRALAQSASVPQQPPSFSESKVEAITHPYSHSISDNTNSNNFKDQTIPETVNQFVFHIFITL